MKEIVEHQHMVKPYLVYLIGLPGSMFGIHVPLVAQLGTTSVAWYNLHFRLMIVKVKFFLLYKKWKQPYIGQPHNHAPSDTSIKYSKTRNAMKDLATNTRDKHSQIFAQVVSQCDDNVQALL
jgi:hypothetical protein